MAKPPRRPKTKRGMMIAIGGGLVVLAVVTLALVYFVLFPTSSPKPFSLTSSTAGTSSSRTGAPVSSGTRLGGSWKIAAGSEAGYRVREKLAFLPAESDAVGRTSEIAGTATFHRVQDHRHGDSCLVQRRCEHAQKRSVDAR